MDSTTVASNDDFGFGGVGWDRMALFAGFYISGSDEGFSHADFGLESPGETEDASEALYKNFLERH